MSHLTYTSYAKSLCIINFAIEPMKIKNFSWKLKVIPHLINTHCTPSTSLYIFLSHYTFKCVLTLFSSILCAFVRHLQ